MRSTVRVQPKKAPTVLVSAVADYLISRNVHTLNDGDTLKSRLRGLRHVIIIIITSLVRHHWALSVLLITGVAVPSSV